MSRLLLGRRIDGAVKGDYSSSSAVDQAMPLHAHKSSSNQSIND